MEAASPTPLRPINNNVVIDRDAAEEKSVGGIVLPASTPKPNMGTVLAVGNGMVLQDGTRVPMQVSVGARVAFDPSAATELDFDGRTVLVLDERGVHGVIV